MPKIPDKFDRNPFIVWGFVVATISIFVLLFGQGEVMDIIRWVIGMPAEETVVIEVIEGNER